MTAHALFIGNNDHIDKTVVPLLCAQRDASELYGLFKRALGYGDRAHLLEAPTQGAVFAKLESIGQEVRAGDSFVFFFAGHGFEVQGGADQYLLLSEARLRLLRSNSSGAPPGVLSVRDLVAETDRWEGVARVFVFDACRTELEHGRSAGAVPVFGSEEVLNRIAARDVVMRRDRPAAGPSPSAPVFIKACLSGQRSHELQDRGGSLFSLAFADVLQQACQANSAIETNAGLLRELDRRMAQLSRQHGLTEPQQPWINDHAGAILLYEPGVRRPDGNSPHEASMRPLGWQAANPLTGLMETFERHFDAGRFSQPWGECCQSTLKQMQDAGLPPGALRAYGQRLAAALGELPVPAGSNVQPQQPAMQPALQRPDAPARADAKPESGRPARTIVASVTLAVVGVAAALWFSQRSGSQDVPPFNAPTAAPAETVAVLPVLPSSKPTPPLQATPRVLERRPDPALQAGGDQSPARSPAPTTTTTTTPNPAPAPAPAAQVAARQDPWRAHADLDALPPGRTAVMAVQGPPNLVAQLRRHLPPSQLRVFKDPFYQQGLFEQALNGDGSGIARLGLEARVSVVHVLGVSAPTLSGNDAQATGVRASVNVQYRRIDPATGGTLHSANLQVHGSGFSSEAAQRELQRTLDERAAELL